MSTLSAPAANADTGEMIFKRFPRVSRLAKACVVSVSGPEEIEQASQGLIFVLRPRDDLEKALREGLSQTCSQVEAGTMDSLILESQVGIEIQVDKASMRQGYDILGTDEAWVHVRAILHGPEGVVVESPIEGHMSQSASFHDVASVIRLAYVAAVDDINELVFTHHEALAQAYLPENAEIVLGEP